MRPSSTGRNQVRTNGSVNPAPSLGPILSASGKVVYLTDNECNFLIECINFLVEEAKEAGPITDFEEKCSIDLINKLTVL